MCDLLWSDPDDRLGWELGLFTSLRPEREPQGWGVSPRGAGYTFGQAPTAQATDPVIRFES